MKRCTDIFVMIPVSGSFNSHHLKENNVPSIYLDQLNNDSQYECSSQIVETISRKNLGTVEIAYSDDEYDSQNIEWVQCQCFLTYQQITGLGVVQLLLPSFRKDPTQIGDIVSSYHFQIRTDNRIFSLQEYLQHQNKLEICGKIRVLYCCSVKDKNAQELEYLLAGETANSEHIDYRLQNSKIQQFAQNDLSVYDFYKLYASSCSLVYYFDGFSEAFEENIEEESILIFICELAILRNAAIARINNQIVEELMQNSDISAKQTLKLQVEYGKTALLWENNIYHYENVQILSDRISTAFGTDELFSKYQRNKDHIDQIASLKSGIAAELEGKVLNALAFILSIAELIQIINGIKDWWSDGMIPYALSIGSAGGLILLIVLLLRRRKRKLHT